jgi:subtilisin family serine protease
MDGATESSQRISPRLRLIVNGDIEVNANRAELSASVKSTSRRADRAKSRLEEAALAADDKKPVEPGSRGRATRTAIVSCFVHMESSSADLPDPTDGGRKLARRGNLATADLTAAYIDRLGGETDANAINCGIAYVESGNPLTMPTPTSVLRTSAEPAQHEFDGNAPRRQKDVIVGIIDVGGFDFAHPDFLRGEETRFLAIWDQGGKKSTGTRRSGKIPAVAYGEIITAQMMNDAIADAAAAGVAASDFVRQSSQRRGSHGTHVASIAAGNRGVCPGALLVGVTIALTDEEVERRTTFFDSTRLAHAVDFLFEMGVLHDCPVSINISLGTNGHAHDGTSPIARWIDSSLARPGRSVCVAAGNAGQEAPQFEGDIGHVSGRIHASGRIPAQGLVADLEWQVIGNGRVDVSENEMEIWYRPGDEFCVQVRSPSGVESNWVGPGQFYENFPVKSRPPSQTFLSIYNERYLPANGANRISVFLSPRLKQPIRGIESGTWIVRLKGIEVRDGRYDAWIERDDPRRLGRLGDVEAWRFPSYFSSRSNIDSHSVSSLACAREVIAVGNADLANERINPSSSEGPTWDGRPKPDIVAPGTDIVAAQGFAGIEERDRWVSMTGTSMASPFVTGVAAEMLAREPRLTSTQILGIMRRTAQPLPGSDYSWHNDAGFGVIEADKCLSLIRQPFESTDVKPPKEERS